MADKIRLAKYIAHAGVCSRKQASRLIDEGVVIVNHRAANHIDHVDDNDHVTVNGVRVQGKAQRVYYAYHKPVGIDCKLNQTDPSSLIHHLPPATRVYPIGRLDKDSRGLLILTNDGEFCNQLIHPDFHQPKRYIVTVDKPLDENFCYKMAHGVPVDKHITLPCTVEQIAPCQFSIILKQGLNRQIRKMAHYCGYRVIDLYREQISSLNLASLNLSENSYLEIQKSDILKN
ncbi:MAG: pseudouridine synthase [Pseudoalteromonas sp.]|uniref:pseudouridine synthase n=1 Tax=unclassified Pseudoalteromonas TaxID=194690 RepID=UPI000C07AE71|nr:MULTISPECIES: pseudouridine synthase [unclassified Pseudoalteromonas]MDP2633417.1 pseudouridine synthase [Pseudoalteromonas sp. 1_MG-2023]PHN90557.1 23S rRNA pseudouridine synthase F [Pseudoalteromonas sp. 3D05]TGE83696.1 rRNA pseudouridine synthase [Pseudoalteromonas sp. KS88]